MNNIETIREFFGWCSVINIGILTLTSMALLLCRGSMSRLHNKMFGLDEGDLLRAYFQYLAQLKIAIIVFNIVPYLALRIIS